MSKAVMFSINKPHTDNIRAGLKKSELRKTPPKQTEPYKAYIYETLKYGGCGAVIGEFTAVNLECHRICVGIPIDLCTNACVTAAEIRKYCRGGLDDLTEIAISDVVIYDEPKELSQFLVTGSCKSDYPCNCRWFTKGSLWGSGECDLKSAGLKPLTRPPQSWCYVEELT